VILGQVPQLMLTSSTPLVDKLTPGYCWHLWFGADHRMDERISIISKLAGNFLMGRQLLPKAQPLSIRRRHRRTQ
jgi:hypothetical protein